MLWLGNGLLNPPFDSKGLFVVHKLFIFWIFLGVFLHAVCGWLIRLIFALTYSCMLFTCLVRIGTKKSSTVKAGSPLYSIPISKN